MTKKEVHKAVNSYLRIWGRYKTATTDNEKSTYYEIVLLWRDLLRISYDSRQLDNWFLGIGKDYETYEGRANQWIRFEQMILKNRK